MSLPVPDPRFTFYVPDPTNLADDDLAGALGLVRAHLESMKQFATMPSGAAWVREALISVHDMLVGEVQMRAEPTALVDDDEIRRFLEPGTD